MCLIVCKMIGYASGNELIFTHEFYRTFYTVFFNIFVQRSCSNFM